MGHTRKQYAPKSQAWRDIVAELGDFALGESQVESIAQNTIKQVKSRFDNFQTDPSIQNAFEFLLQISFAFKQNDPTNYLQKNKIIDKSDLDILNIARAATNYKSESIDSNEYNTFARQAVVDAINNWYVNNIEQGRSLFDEKIDSHAILRKSADAGGFCELSRLFFSNVTERYLKYFLEREASSAITNVNERIRFNKEIEEHVDSISKHAFETSKITQSFAAGWYYNHVQDSYPSEKEIKGFIARAIEKMKSELLLEEQV